MDSSKSDGLHRQLWFQVLVAMALGVGIGLLFPDAGPKYLGWLGTLFVRALKFVIVPLVLCSVASGIASIGAGRDLGRLGLKTIGFYALSSLLAIGAGQLVVNIIRPGVGLEYGSQLATKSLPAINSPNSLFDIVLNFLPNNPVEALAAADMMGIIGFSIIVGVAITQAPAKSRETMRSFVNAGFDVMMVVTGFIIRLAPLGVLGLVTTAAADIQAQTVVAFGWYFVTILAGLAIHGLIVLPLLLLLLGRINPLNFAWAMKDALLTAVSTSSSSATMPVTLRTVENEVGVSNRVSSFVIPLGATVNMDGTALYECVGVIFIAQALGYPLDMTQQLLIVVTALAASVGAAGIPSAGLVMIFVVLQAVGIQGTQAEMIVGIMLAIDRPLDMMRTAINVFSDSVCSAVVARSEGETLNPGIAARA